LTTHSCFKLNELTLSQSYQLPNAMPLQRLFFWKLAILPHQEVSLLALALQTALSSTSVIDEQLGDGGAFWDQLNGGINSKASTAHCSDLPKSPFVI
jgi:hypothetical protein